MKIANPIATKILENLFKNVDLSDVQFVLKNKAGEEVNIPANKAILASISPTFKEMFFDNGDKEAIVHISDGCAEAFEEFLQFFYMTEVELTAANIADVWKLIEKYKVPNC